jgi:hypothetical protein
LTSTYPPGIGQKLGESYNAENRARNDVKGVMYFMYPIITRDPKYRFLQLEDAKEKNLGDRTRWVKNHQVDLDSDVSAFYDELMAWVRKRREGPHLTHYTQAPRHIDFPVRPRPPKDKSKWGSNLKDVSTFCQLRLEAGRPVLSWQRPAKARVDKDRRLLATGRYVDEEVTTVPIPVPDPKRGFTQPPTRVTRARLDLPPGNRQGGSPTNTGDCLRSARRKMP